MLNILIVAITSFFVSYISTPPIIFLAKKYGLLDDDKKRKHPAHTHQGIVPRAGGLSIFFGILATSVYFLPQTKILTGILIGGFLIVLMGLFDDYYDLSPYLRFILNILIALCVIFFGLGIPYISNPLADGVIRLDSFIFQMNIFGARHFFLLSNIFAIIWIVAIMNFVNWSKGIDGQMPGFVAISAIFLGILALRYSAHDISKESVTLLSFIVAGSFLGFLPWNFFPQKITPGYGGGALAGFLLAVLSILSWGKLGTMILVLSIPLTDALYVVLRRISNFKSPFKGDALHFHHRLLEVGWGRRRIAVFYWIVSFLFGASSLFFHGYQKIFVLLMVFISLAIFILIINRIKLNALPAGRQVSAKR